VRRPLKGAALAVGLAIATVTACSGSNPAAQDQPSTSPSTSPQTSGSPSPSPQQLAAERAYAKFWRLLPAASRASTDAARVGLLVSVTTDPELTQLISGFHRMHQQGRALYGFNAPRATVTDLSGQRAVVRDCQDSHAAGVEKVATGQHLTVGVSRHLVTSVLLLRGHAWKVSSVRYAAAGTSC
jgi:hypothetical protein